MTARMPEYLMAKSRTLTMKTKYEELYTVGSSSNKKKNTSVPSPTTHTPTTAADRNNNKFEEAMIFTLNLNKRK